MYFTLGRIFKIELYHGDITMVGLPQWDYHSGITTVGFPRWDYNGGLFNCVNWASKIVLVVFFQLCQLCFVNFPNWVRL